MSGICREQSFSDHCVSIFHCNIRSLRNKLDYILDNFCDFDLICFTETHLDSTISSENLFLGDQYDCPYRKDRTDHGGRIIVYPPAGLIHKRRYDLEIFWDECIWLEIRMNNQYYLFGVFFIVLNPMTHIFKLF